MKFLFVLLLLVSCNDKADRSEQIQRLKDLDRIQCEQYIKGFEAKLLSTFHVGSYDICDLDPRNQLCDCADYEKLPFNCGYTQYRLSQNIERKQKEYNEMNIIIKKAKSSKATKQSIDMLTELRDGYKADVEELKNNQEFYTRLCKENEENGDEVY